MAKLYGGIFGRSRKKIGDIVTYVLGGQQIARSMATTVANPRSNSQMLQRTKLANMVAFYRANARWMEKYAFEGRKAGWSVYNAFVSANQGEVQVHLTKQQAAQHNAIVAPYIITSGSLPSIEWNKRSDGSWLSNLNVPLDFGEPDTVADLSRALVENNNGIRYGMQLSIIVNYQTQYNGVYGIISRAYEVVLSKNDTTDIQDRVPVEMVQGVTGQLCFQNTETGYVCGFAYILSETTRKKTSVSSQSLILDDTSIYEVYKNNAAAAAESYGSSDDVFLEAGYVGTTGSNSDVDLGNSILTVNGKSASQSLSIANADNVVIQMASPVDAAAASIVISFNGYNTTNSYTGTATSVSGSEITLENIELTATTNVKQFSVSVAGLSYVITFAQPSDEGLVD